LATNTPVSLKLEPRTEIGEHLRALRRQGRLPGVVYGHNIDAVTVAVDGREFAKAFLKVGRNQLVDLQIGEEPIRKALVREVQRNPRDGGLLHVDFYQVNLKEKIESDVPLEFEGEVELVAKGEADLQHGLHALKVECLPTDIPEAFEVDLTPLEEVESELRISDLTVPKGVTVLDEPEELVVKIVHRRELKVEEEVVTAETAVVGEGEEAGEEGAPAAEEQAETKK
jgi:large subunit ribosomal protein L25